MSIYNTHRYRPSYDSHVADVYGVVAETLETRSGGDGFPFRSVFAWALLHLYHFETTLLLNRRHLLGRRTVSRILRYDSVTVSTIIITNRIRRIRLLFKQSLYLYSFMRSQSEYIFCQHMLYTKSAYVNFIINK